MRVRGCFLGALFTVALTGWVARADVVVIESSKDNTLYESASGSLSNGAGDHLFAGVTSGARSIRRALVAFDVASAVPPGSSINSVSLTLRMSRTTAGPETVTLHRVLTDWGEGDSDAVGAEGQGASAAAGDATWIHTFFDTGRWQNEGGDFEPTASASALVGGIGSYNWGSTTDMVTDVRDWLDSPQTNFGWILVGNEDGSATTKRFDSRENSAAVRPQLEIDFETAPASPTPTATPSATPTPTSTADATATPTRTPTHTPTPGPCFGDCNTDGRVTIDELVLGVDIALGLLPIDQCEELDQDGNDEITIDEVVFAVVGAVFGCVPAF